MCGKKYFSRNRNGVDRRRPEEVTCPECLQGMKSTTTHRTIVSQGL